MAGTIKRVLLSLVAVFVGGWFYSLLIVPMVEGAPGRSVSRPTTDLPPGGGILDDDATELGRYLEPGAWELQPHKKLQLDHGRVYFQQWVPLDDGRLEVSPFTLVLHDRDSAQPGEPSLPAKAPIFLQAPEGAILEFDVPFQQGLGPSGKLMGATLRGDVKIFRPAVENGAEALRIETRNIQIQSQRIFTPHRVDFRLGPHHGSGQNLVIELLADRPTAKGKVAKIRGIRTMELVKLDYLSLEIPQKSQESSDAALASASSRPSHVEVRCAGPFVLDMAKKHARFQQNVQLVHLDNQAQRELASLDCRQLTIEFDSAPPGGRQSGRTGTGTVATPARNKPTRGEGIDDLQVRRLIAVGQPAILHSDERDFHAEAEYLSYDPIEQRIVMRDSDHVLLMHKDMRFESPAFEYDMDDGSQLGKASAVGPGRMVRLAGTDRPGLDVQWQEELQLRPHEGLHALSLYGNPQLRMGQEGQFFAKELHVWLAEKPAANASGDKATKIEPVKLLAQGDVTIDSPKLAGTTQRLEVFWDSVPVTDSPPATADVPPDTSGGPGSPTVVAPRASGDQPKPGRKLNVTGNFVRARLVPNQKSFAVQEVTVDGQARLTEQSGGDDDPQPLTIAGKMLQVNALADDLYAAYVVAEDEGQEQATLAARGMELFGQHLQLNQAQHRMWMDGVGEARLHSQSQHGSANQLTGPVVVRWQGGLDFDGQLLRIRDEVNIWLQSTNAEGNLSTIQIQGERLDIRLTKKVDLTAKSESNGEEPQAEVETLILGGKVLLTHWESRPDGQWQAVDRLTAMGAGVDYQTGNLLAGGPGVAQSIRLQGAFKAFPGTDPEPKVKDEKSLTHVRIEYARAIEGNIFDKRMAFVEQVQVFSDDVPSWDSWLEREELQRSSTMVYLRCDRLTVDEVMTTRGAPASWLAQAIGNAYMSGRGVEASATRMTYDQAKDLLTLVAEGRDDAQLTWQRQPSAPRDYVRAREIKYWKTLNQVEVDGVSSLSSNARIGSNSDKNAPVSPSGRR